jgi:hypothetical protein
LRKIVVGAAIAIAIGGVASAAPVRPAAQQADLVTDSPSGQVKLVSFDSCDNALSGLRQAAWPYIGPYGFGGPGYALDATGDVAIAAPGTPRAASGAEQQKSIPEQNNGQSSTHSNTNSHETGVDEPDIVKTDGKRLVSVLNGRLKVIDVASRKVTGTLELPEMSVSQMLVSGDRALLVTAQNSVIYDMPVPRGKPAPQMASGTGSKLVLVDLVGTPRILGTLGIDGGYVDARQVGSVARVVVRSQPQLRFVYPDATRTLNSSLEENREIALRSTVDDWLPRYQFDSDGTHSQGRLVNCDRVSHAAAYSGTAMLTVLTLDLSRSLGTGDPVSVVAGGDTVYGTGTSLYIADDHQSRVVPLRFDAGTMSGQSMPTGMPTPTGKTQIHRFDLPASGPPRYAGSAEVEGTLLNQYSLSEYNGHLRVATTVGQAGPIAEGPNDQRSQSQSIVTVLARNGNALTQVGKVDGLGKGERIYAVRFIGAVGYVVTFRQMDPLYTLDLSQPTRPRVVGELKITGYSAYLHPVSEGKVLGVGQEATEQGRRVGAQVSLFDVGNPATPNRMAQQQIEGGSSEAEYDPHAFLYWPARDLVVVPVVDNKTMKSQPDYYQPLNYALVLRLDGAGLAQVGRVAHPAGMIRRSLVIGDEVIGGEVIGDELWTVSDAGIMVNDLDKLAQRAWIPLR